MTGWDKLRIEVRRILNAKGVNGKPLPINRAAKICGIAATSVYNMLNGSRVEPGTVALFARGMGEDEARLLALVGYTPEEVPSIIRTPATFDDPRLHELASGLVALSPDKRDFVLQGALALMRGIAPCSSR